MVIFTISSYIVDINYLLNIRVGLEKIGLLGVCVFNEIQKRKKSY